MDQSIAELHARLDYIEDYLSTYTPSKRKMDDDTSKQSKQRNHIPKVIYTYWNTIELPEFIKMCIETWRIHNPAYEVVIISQNDLANYGISQEIVDWCPYPQTVSDFLRLSVLSQHGGIWCGASTFMTTSLEWLQNSTKDFVGYYRKTAASSRSSPYPVIESGFSRVRPTVHLLIFGGRNFNKSLHFHLWTITLTIA